MRVPLAARAAAAWLATWLAMCLACCDTALPPHHKYSTRLVRTKYGPLRGIVVHSHPPVEAYLGVPYATPPLGTLRYMPPVTPSRWRATRLADVPGAACPQRLPKIVPREDAMLQYPRTRLKQIEAMLPLLANQSEDCLYVNLYVPTSGFSLEDEETQNIEAELPSSGLACILIIHGESYEWGSGSIYDGTMLAAYGNVIVATINFRLGILGFLKTGAKGSAQGNFGLMDLVAGLHWLKENLPAFGGDPERVTILGHGTGAALGNFLAVSPVAKELLKRVILLSGSGLSTWALQRDSLAVKRKVAEQTGCHGDLLEEDIAPCLRNKPLAELLNVELQPPRFLPGFAPFLDGTVLVHTSNMEPSGGSRVTGGGLAAVATASGYQLAHFPHIDLMFGLTSTESFLELNAQDLEFGFNESRRDRILRTFVRNIFYYHLNEIFSTLKNEYTDWDKPVQNPVGVRDSTLEILSDGETAAPLIRLGYLHSMRGGSTYFAHFQHTSSERDYPQRLSTVLSEDLPYYLGLPLASGLPHHIRNYTLQDQHVSKMMMQYIANFAKSGNPNNPSNGNVETQTPTEALPFWDTYDTINQLYLEISHKAEMRSHYRGHKMSLWLSLIPQLHKPGDDMPDSAMRHHHFQEDTPNFYDGPVRPQTLSREHVPIPITKATTVRPASPAVTQIATTTTTECLTNISKTTESPDEALLKRLANSHYQSYTAALTVTIAVGCFLLLLNVLIFAGIYHQRGSKSRSRSHKDYDDGSSSSSGDNYEAKMLACDARAFETKIGIGYDRDHPSTKLGRLRSSSKFDLKSLSDLDRDPTFGEYTCYDEKNSLARSKERSLPDISSGDCSVVKIDTQKPDILDERSSESDLTRTTTTFTEPSRSVDISTQVKFGPVPSGPGGLGLNDVMEAANSSEASGPGILRNPNPAPVGIMKKRVQIQEISV